MNQNSETLIIEQVEAWLENVVIGLNLCPFAAKPQRNGQIRIVVSQAKIEELLLEDILQEMHKLQSTTVSELETTLVVTPYMLNDFYEYNLFINWIDAMLEQQQLEGEFQVATFHPDYCFAGNEPEDVGNLTNRSPYPIFHLIREDSLEKALKHFPNPETIPDTNIETVSSLSEKDIEELFPHLKSSD
ncbi:DUF1415 domain-containing protein [Vibrio marisflavi]|uniref:DUF1415 domain-containing protein n=1 Tax=Vibrio marisflavi CECT 7928 TaxID=634439 RepID=A0ABN8E749_9VIBR|nr:DUF1415 domain-containing protein [Vibrio marisflavi]CAH0539693.1 hypothetical protein VMF7928_02370 [Vibrio marisflavi CECT 7928]